jgi:hypothetical protein
MPFTLTFHSLAEKTPQYGEQILYFSTSLDSFDTQVGNLREATVEYYWDEYDEDGSTGNSVCYDPEDSDPTEGLRLCFSLGGDYLSEGFVIDDDEPRKNNFYWINAEDFWNKFPEPVSNY